VSLASCARLRPDQGVRRRPARIVHPASGWPSISSRPGILDGISRRSEPVATPENAALRRIREPFLPREIEVPLPSSGASSKPPATRPTRSAEHRRVSTDGGPSPPRRKGTAPGLSRRVGGIRSQTSQTSGRGTSIPQSS
jgi:hypothetical protein